MSHNIKAFHYIGIGIDIVGVDAAYYTGLQTQEFKIQSYEMTRQNNL